jgi:hypothetical protein
MSVVRLKIVTCFHFQPSDELTWQSSGKHTARAEAILNHVTRCRRRAIDYSQWEGSELKQPLQKRSQRFQQLIESLCIAKKTQSTIA